MGPWCLGPTLIPAPRVAVASGGGEKALCAGDAEVALRRDLVRSRVAGGLVTAGGVQGRCRGAQQRPRKAAPYRLSMPSEYRPRGASAPGGQYSSGVDTASAAFPMRYLGGTWLRTSGVIPSRCYVGEIPATITWLGCG